VLAAATVAAGFSFFWILYAAIAKFQIIGSTILIEAEWENSLITFASSFAGLNLHIPLPWDNSFKNTGRQLHNLQQYITNTKIARNKLLLTNLFWVAMVSRLINSMFT
jgi:hypothetical protein